MNWPPRRALGGIQLHTRGSLVLVARVVTLCPDRAPRNEVNAGDLTSFVASDNLETARCRRLKLPCHGSGALAARKPPRLATAGERQPTLVDDLSVLHDKQDRLRVVDVGCRVLAEDHQVREFAGLD